MKPWENQPDAALQRRARMEAARRVEAGELARHERDVFEDAYARGWYAALVEGWEALGVEAPPRCSRDGCERRAAVRGLCQPCHERKVS